jgi:ATP-binding cassette, subfamily C, type I secretion system permease/ATPase
VESLSWTLPNSLRPILRNISFELAPGEALAIVGPSAAGKSSLARLLVGVRRPSAGQVRLDGAEVADWPRAEFGRYVGYLPQDVSLFPGATIAENICRMGEPDAEAVIEAARKAGVHDMVLRLPKGYDTPLDEVASVLSGGQRQRIALARAIFGKPSLVVLDEPNANLDTEGDAALAAALQELKARGTTAVVVTHRPALVAQVDKVLLLKDGVVEMFGPRKQVLERLRTRPEPVPSTVSVPAPARQMA